MKVLFLPTSTAYHDYKEDHILVSCHSYYNNAGYCKMHYILEAYPEYSPHSITEDSGKLLIQLLLENRDNQNLPVVLVANDAKIIEHIYYFLANVFGNIKDFDATNDMTCYIILNKIWQKMISINQKKKWQQSKPRKPLDVLC